MIFVFSLFISFRPCYITCPTTWSFLIYSDGFLSWNFFFALVSKIFSCKYLGVDTKQRLSKQRLLQNSDSYKKAPITKQRLIQTANVTKRLFLQNDDCCKKKYFYIFNKNIMLFISTKIICNFFFKTEKVDFCNARMYRGQTPVVE